VSCLPCAAWEWRRATSQSPGGTCSLCTLQYFGGWCCGYLSITGPCCSPLCNRPWPTSMRIATYGMTSQTSSSIIRAAARPSNTAPKAHGSPSSSTASKQWPSAAQSLTPSANRPSESCLSRSQALHSNLCYPRILSAEVKALVSHPVGTFEWWDKWSNQAEETWGWFQPRWLCEARTSHTPL
jgi:hypothetical protein